MYIYIYIYILFVSKSIKCSLILLYKPHDLLKVWHYFTQNYSTHFKTLQNDDCNMAVSICQNITIFSLKCIIHILIELLVCNLITKYLDITYMLIELTFDETLSKNF